MCEYLRRGRSAGCWGDNHSGQLGRSAPRRGAARTAASTWGRTGEPSGILAGLEHTCAILEDGGVKCWGLNTWGQLGVGDTANRGDGVAAMGDGLPIVDLGVGRRAVAIAAASSATCALLDGGRVKCWGDSYQGALGYGDISTRGAMPGTMGDALREVSIGSRDGAPLEAEQIVAIDYHSFCAIIADTGPGESGLKCWGSNDYCELGIGTGLGQALRTIHRQPGTGCRGSTSGRPRRARPAGPWRPPAGSQFICVLGDDGAVACWGDNWSGQLGIGKASAPRSCRPEETGGANLVPLPAPAVALGARGQSAGGGAHACAVLATRQVTCWGENDAGQLGTGDTVPLMTPSAALAFGDRASFPTGWRWAPTTASDLQGTAPCGAGEATGKVSSASRRRTIGSATDCDRAAVPNAVIGAWRR